MINQLKLYVILKIKYFKNIKKKFYKKMFKKKSQQVRRAYGGWGDDDNSPQNNNQINNNSNIPKFLKNSNQNSQNYSSNYRQENKNNNEYRRDNQTFDLEQKLFEDILQPTGISIKPDLKLLRDFCQRAQRLDKVKIINLIMERIVRYEVYIGGEASIKMFLKCLYLVEFIVDNQVNELYDGFANQQELFENIKMTYSNNKKVIEVVNHILKMLNNQNNESNVNNNQGNTNLLDIDEGNNNNNQGNNNTNLLEDIFGGNSNNNNNNMNIGNNNNMNLFNYQNQSSNIPFNIQSNKTLNNNNNQVPAINNQPQQPKNQFSFIKNQQQNNQQTQHNQKTGFSFIKSSQNNNNPNPQTNNDLNNIFQNTPQTTNTTNKPSGGFKFIKKQDNALENVFNQQNKNENENNIFQMENIDLTKQNQNIQQQQPTQPTFNYQQVYENTEVFGVQKKSNDPFNFVDDLLKPKK